MSQTTANPVASSLLAKRAQRTHNDVQDALRAFAALVLTIDQAGPDDLPRIKREASAYGEILAAEGLGR